MMTETIPLKDDNTITTIDNSISLLGLSGEFDHANNLKYFFHLYN